MTDTVSDESQRDAARLTAWQLVSYGLLSMPLAMAGLVLLTYVPTFYAIDMGLGLGLVGGLIAGGRILDILTDPLIGHLSDSTRSRLGPRKPWMIAGIAGFCISLWLLLVPPQDAGVLYLVLIGGAYFLCFTLLDVPYSAVGLEISPHVDERSVLAGAKSGFQIAGAILAGSLPLLLAASASDSLPTIAAITIGLAAFGFVLFFTFVPHRDSAVAQPRVGFVTALKLAAGEHRFTKLVSVFFIIQMANAFFTGLAVLYITYIVKAPELAGLFFGLMFLSTALFLPLWLAIAKRVGKAKCWQAGIVISMLAFLATPFVGEGDVIAVCIMFALLGSTFGCDAVMPTSMLADISFEQEQQDGNRLSGVYLAIKNGVSKLSFVAPMGLAFPVLGYFNFESAGNYDGQILFVFMIFFALLPIALKVIGMIMLRRGGIDSVPETKAGEL